MSAMEIIKKIIVKYRHAWVFLYVLIYIPWFTYLERHVTTKYYPIYSTLDDYIPFVEYFIIPYLLWFAFIAITIAYFFFANRREFYQLTAFLFAGMTIFLIVCTVFPNGQNLRPDVFVRDNIFVDMVKTLYATDTPTNVLPSIHVFNSIAVSIAIARNATLKKHRVIQYSAFVLAILIILSTVFLKQHSVTDVFAAFAMAGVLYPLVYVTQDKKVPKLFQQPI